MSACEYWILDRTNGTSDVDVTLSWNRSACSLPANNSTKLMVSRWDGSKWETHSNGGVTGSASSTGTIVSSSAVTDFSPFTLSASLVSILPVEITYFKGNFNHKNHTVNLTWESLWERNNDYYYVEKSTDLENWQSIDTVQGRENSVIRRVYS